MMFSFVGQWNFIHFIPWIEYYGILLVSHNFDLFAIYAEILYNSNHWHLFYLFPYETYYCNTRIAIYSYSFTCRGINGVSSMGMRTLEFSLEKTWWCVFLCFKLVFENMCSCMFINLLLHCFRPVFNVIFSLYCLCVAILVFMMFFAFRA